MQMFTLRKSVVKTQLNYFRNICIRDLIIPFPFRVMFLGIKYVKSNHCDNLLLLTYIGRRLVQLMNKVTHVSNNALL